MSTDQPLVNMSPKGRASGGSHEHENERPAAEEICSLGFDRRWPEQRQRLLAAWSALHDEDPLVFFHSRGHWRWLAKKEVVAWGDQLAAALHVSLDLGETAAESRCGAVLVVSAVVLEGWLLSIIDAALAPDGAPFGTGDHETPAAETGDQAVDDRRWFHLLARDWRSGSGRPALEVQLGGPPTAVAVKSANVPPSASRTGRVSSDQLASLLSGVGPPSAGRSVVMLPSRVSRDALSTWGPIVAAGPAFAVPLGLAYGPAVLEVRAHLAVATRGDAASLGDELSELSPRQWRRLADRLRGVLVLGEQDSSHEVQRLRAYGLLVVTAEDGGASLSGRG